MSLNSFPLSSVLKHGTLPWRRWRNLLFRNKHQSSNAGIAILPYGRPVLYGKIGWLSDCNWGHRSCSLGHDLAGREASRWVPRA